MASVVWRLGDVFLVVLAALAASKGGRDISCWVAGGRAANVAGAIRIVGGGFCSCSSPDSHL